MFGKQAHTEEFNLYFWTLLMFLYFRTLLGPELLIVHLNMKENDVVDRINKRHNGNKDILDALMVILAALVFKCIMNVFCLFRK